MPPLLNLLKLIAPVLFLGIVCGCSPSGPPKGDIRGTVTLDGQPLDQGSVQFFPLDPTASASAMIRDGKFRTEAPVGKFKVVISAVVVTGPPAKSRYDTPEAVERIPDRYNTKSELTIEVQPGLNQPVYDLQSK